MSELEVCHSNLADFGESGEGMIPGAAATDSSAGKVFPLPMTVAGNLYVLFASGTI